MIATSMSHLKIVLSHQTSGFTKASLSDQPSDWKRDGAIFALDLNGIDYFPGYALNPNAGFRPYKSLADVINVFDGKKDAWSLAYWFSSVNSYLGAARQQDFLALEPQKVIAAAKDAVADSNGVFHG